jgi:signal transduction histidine kinase
VKLPTSEQSELSAHGQLLRENQKLRKINRVLMERVERSTDAQGNAFSLFQAAITLENTIRQRTAELHALNQQLRHEIAERTEVERALELARMAAEHANVGKTKFLAAASHDLLQPLNIARLFVDALAELLEDAESRHIVGRIDAALEGAEGLLTTLLEMSKLDAGALIADISQFPIQLLLRRIADDYAVSAEERNLRFHVVVSDAVVRSDVRLLDRLLRNFVSNAVRYTVRGGVLLGCRRRGGLLRIEVWDTGCGIPQDRLGEVFEEFRRLDDAAHDSHGMGLGLAIVERIARLLKLEIRVKSREGRGSVFGVDVPLADPAACRRAPAVIEPPHAAKAFAGKRVLVVDDDSDALEGMSLMLRTWGCRTVAAQSLADAVESAHDLQGLDLIVADYHLGEHGGTGLDAIERVRERLGSAVRAVVVTADRTDEVKSRVAQVGHRYLNKPVRADRLRSLMSHLLA